jgi:hypothetical protein
MLNCFALNIACECGHRVDLVVATMIHNRGINDDADVSESASTAPAGAHANVAGSAALLDLELAHKSAQKARERASALANPELVAIMADSARRAQASVETPLPRGFAALTAEAAKDAALLARMRDANRGAHALIAHAHRTAHV